MHVRVHVHVHVIVTVKAKRRFTLNLGKTATQRPRVWVHARGERQRKNQPSEEATTSSRRQRYSPIQCSTEGKTRPYQTLWSRLDKSLLRRQIAQKNKCLGSLSLTVQLWIQFTDFFCHARNTGTSLVLRNRLPRTQRIFFQTADKLPKTSMTFSLW